MSTPDPLKSTNDMLSKNTISAKQFLIAGILTTVYGLDEISEGTKHVACLWLLHPRLSSQARMAPVAQATIAHWHRRSSSKQTRAPPLGIIAVSFDQRNHGSREVDPVANEAWKNGNPKHAQDMFSIYRAPYSSSYHSKDLKLTKCRRHRGGHLTVDYLPGGLYFP